MHLYLVERPERAFGRPAPDALVLLCSRRDVAHWVAGSSSDRANVWEGASDLVAGWLLVRWRGLDLDYGHVVHAVDLPDGTAAGFHHDRTVRPWCLLPGATWYSRYRIPSNLLAAGVEPAGPELQESIRASEELAKELGQTGWVW